MNIAHPVQTFSLEVPPPLHTPVYRLDRSWEQNAAEGPNFTGPYVEVPQTPKKEFFGRRVASRIGVAASLLVNESWFELYSRLGFDLLTYKTVRSRARLAHPVPNWLFLDDRMDLAHSPREAQLPVLDGAPSLPFSATTVSSLGIPSSPPEVWLNDIQRCRARLRLKQVMIASVVGTANADTTQTEIIDDFCKLAAEVKDAGAHVIELNFSCPNVGRRESEVYRDVEIATRIASAARGAIDSTPLLIKIGPIEERDRMAKLLRSLSGVVDGVVMINGPIRAVVDAAGASAFGAGRERAGMAGGAVFDIAMACVRNSVDIVRRDGLNLEILAVGGVCSVERIKAYFDAGAYAVLGASACAWDPYLAIRAKRRYPML